MKLSTIAICIALTVPAVWGQKYPKRALSTAPDHLSLRFRSLKTHSRAFSPRQAAAPQAPGVVQSFVNPATGALDAAYFISTADIPAGSQISGGLTLLDDGSYIDFTPFATQQDLPPGGFINLPTISAFGDVYLQAGASFDYTVLVSPPNGVQTEADAAFLVGETLAYSDLAGFAPVLGSLTQTIATNKDVILTISGYFTGDPVQVVMSDLYAGYVPPAGAVTVTANQVTIDMSQVQGFDLTSLDGLLVSVSEDGYADTLAFRYLPPADGTYNQAPQ